MVTRIHHAGERGTNNTVDHIFIVKIVVSNTETRSVPYTVGERDADQQSLWENRIHAVWLYCES